MVKNGWDKSMKSLELLDSLSWRTLVRLTAVKNLNISNHNLKEYYELVKKANPDFFEIKGFTLQAKALMIKERLKSDKPLQHYFPEYEFLKAMAKEFEEISNYPLIYSNEPSRDFLFTVRWNKDKDPVIKVPWQPFIIEIWGFNWSIWINNDF